MSLFDENVKLLSQTLPRPEYEFDAGKLDGVTLRVESQPNLVWVHNAETRQEVRVRNPHRFTLQLNTPVIVKKDANNNPYIDRLDFDRADDFLGDAMGAVLMADAPTKAITQPVQSKRRYAFFLIDESNLRLRITDGFYDSTYFPGQSLDIATEVSGISSNSHAWVIISLNTSTGSLNATVGPNVSSTTGILTTADAAAISLAANELPLWALDMFNGDTTLPNTFQDRVVDMRASLAAGGGGVSGPATSTDNAIARWDGTGGDTLQDSLVTIDDSGTASTPTDFVAFEGTAKEVSVGDDTLQNTSTGLRKWESPGLATDGTNVTVSAGAGHIVNFHDDPDNPTFTEFTWLQQVLSGFTANTVTYILVNAAGTAFTQTSLPTQQQRRENIWLGRAVDVGGTVVQVLAAPDVFIAPAQQLHQLIDLLGVVNDGISLTNNGTNLKFDLSAGALLQRGGGFIANNADPNEVTLAAASPKTFAYITQTAGSTGADTTDLVPGSYDVGGTITAIPGSNNRATNQRVYLFPSGNCRVAYGQTFYTNLADAIEGLATESFTINPLVPGNGVLIAVVAITKGCTDLSDTATARILPASKFGESAVGGSGQSTTTLQQAYNNSADGQIDTDGTRGPVTIREGTGTATTNVLRVRDNSNNTTFEMRGNGSIQITSTEATLLDMTNTGGAVSTLMNAYGTGAAQFTGIAYGGSPGSESAILNGRIMFALSGLGYDGTTTALGTQVLHVATENWSGSAKGSEIRNRVNQAGTGNARSVAISGGNNSGQNANLSRLVGPWDLGRASARWTDIYSVNAVDVSSDMRKKRNAAIVPPRIAFEVISAVEGIRFRWKDRIITAEGGGTETIRDDTYKLGVSAQSIVEAFAAQTDGQGNPLSAMDYGVIRDSGPVTASGGGGYSTNSSSLIGLMIQADKYRDGVVTDLVKRLNQAENQLATARTTIQQQNQRITAIENLIRQRFGDVL